MVYGDKSIFAKAFERLAYAFTKAVMPCKTKVQHNNQLEMYYVSLGIPVRNIEQHLKDKGFDVSVSHPEDGTTVFTAKLKEPLFTEEEFLAWKGKLIAENKTAKENNVVVKEVIKEQSDTISHSDNDNSGAFTENTFYKMIVDDILNQQLSEYTPMMALNYLSELQKRIRNERI